MSNKAYATQYVGDSPMLMEAMRLRNQRRLQRENLAAETARQKIAGEQQLGLENLRFKNESSRDTAKRAGDVELENVRSLNTVRQLEVQQALEVLKSAGIIGTPENRKVYDQALTDPIIRGKLQKQMMINEVQADPSFINVFGQGMKASAASPIFQNLQAGTVDVAPGSTTLQPNSAINPSPNLNQWNQVQGAMANETVIPNDTVIPGDPAKGIASMTLPGRDTVVRQMTPPRIRVPQNILDAAGQQPSVNPMPLSRPINPLTGNTNMSPELLQRLMQQIMATPRG